MSTRKSGKNNKKKKNQAQNKDPGKAGGSFKDKQGSKAVNSAWDDPNPPESILGMHNADDSMREPLVFESEKNK